MRLRMRLLVTGLCIAAVASFGAGSALADSLVLDPTFAPAAEIPSVIKFDAQSSTTAYATFVWVKYRPAGGAPCAPTRGSDSGTEIVNGDTLNGAATLQRVFTFASAGQYLICGWIADNNGSRTTATLSQVLSVRAPVATLAAQVPALVPFDRPFFINFSGKTEVKRFVYALVRPAGGPPCAPTYNADSGNTLNGDPTAEGAFSVSQEITLRTKGTFVVCSWLVRGGSDLAPLATATATFTNVPPVIASPRPIVSSVRVNGRKLRTTVGLSRGGRIVVRLVGKGRRIGIGAVSASGPRTVVISYTRPKSVKTGRYTLEMTFTAKGATKASVLRRSVVLR